MLACGLNLVQDVAGADCMRFCGTFLREAASSSISSRTSPMRARLWPMGAPYPEAELDEPPVMPSRRRQQRWSATRLRRRVLNTMVGFYSFLALGCPRSTAGAVVGACRLTGLQWEAVNLMDERLRFVCRAAGRVSVAGGRQLVLDELLKDYDFGDGYVTGGTAGGAPMSVVSELISLPSKAAVVPLVDVVPPFVARCLNTPDAFSLAPADWPDQRPAGCSMVTDSEWMKLLARLLACGMVVIREEKDLLKWGSRVVTAGMFAVAKPGGKLRLIIDRRWGNSMEHALLVALTALGTTGADMKTARRLIQLPGASTFGEMILAPRDRLSIQLDDLRGYYYLLEWPAHMINSGAVGSLLTESVRDELGVAFDGVRPYACLTVPAMGDAKVPDLAQMAHQWVLRRAGLLDDSRWLAYGSAPPPSNIWEGVYIDDRAVVAIIRDGHAAADQATVAGLLERADAAYDEAGLVRHEGKRVRNAAAATIWGCTLNGPQRTVRSEPAKLAQVIGVTLLAVAQGRCTGKVLQRLAGLWVHHLLCRRAYLCLLDEVFRAAEKARPYVVASLSSAVKGELLMCCFLASDAQTPLDAPFFPVVSATDASLHHGAVVESRRSLKEVSWLWSRASHRGCYSNATFGPEINPNGDLVPADDVMHAWVGGVQFRETVSYRFDRQEHINLLEAHAHKTWAMRAARSRTCWRARHARLLDSGVVIGAIGRGRSSSRQLNRVLRSTLPHTGPTDILVGPIWTRSGDNAADDPTRGRAVREAGPMDQEILDYVEKAGGRWEQSIRASELLLAARVERLAPRPSGDAATHALAEQGNVEMLLEDPHLVESTPAPASGSVPVDSSRPVFLEVFSGVAALSKVAAQAGFLVLPPIDVSYGPDHDLTKESNVVRLIYLVKSRRVTWIHFGTPCTTFCRFFVMFCKRCTRTTGLPEGLGTFDREIEGNLLLDVTCRLARAAMAAGTYWTLENPRASLLWAMPSVVRLLKQPLVDSAFVVYCRFGAKYLKRTRFIGTLPRLAALSCKCLGGHQHTRIQGYTRYRGKSVLVSHLAAAYPWKLCQALVGLAWDAVDDGLDTDGAGRTQEGPQLELGPTRRGGASHSSQVRADVPCSKLVADRLRPPAGLSAGWWRPGGRQRGPDGLPPVHVQREPTLLPRHVHFGGDSVLSPADVGQSEGSLGGRSHVEGCRARGTPLARAGPRPLGADGLGACRPWSPTGRPAGADLSHPSAARGGVPAGAQGPHVAGRQRVACAGGHGGDPVAKNGSRRRKSAACGRARRHGDLALPVGLEQCASRREAVAVDFGRAQPLVPSKHAGPRLAGHQIHTRRAEGWRGDLLLPERQQRGAALVERQMGDAYLPQALRARECRDVGLGPTHSRGSQKADIIGAELG